MSISGQNERWAQLNAYQPPPSSQAGPNGGWASAVGTTGSSGATSSAGTAGGASGGLSDTMSLALMAFSGAWGTGSGASSQAPGQSGAAPVMPSADPPSSTQDASGGYSDGFQQQFAFSAYTANSSSLTNAASAPLTSINV